MAQGISMIRKIAQLGLLCVLGAMAASSAGCASSNRGEFGLTTLTRQDSVMLFDSRPAWPSAEESGLRSDWPSTVSLYSGGERIYYRESIYDVQGQQPWSQNYTYRRFRLERQGSAAR
jgi:hypothetical protein